MLYTIIHVFVCQVAHYCALFVVDYSVLYSWWEILFKIWELRRLRRLVWEHCCHSSLHRLSLRGSASAHIVNSRLLEWMGVLLVREGLVERGFLFLNSTLEFIIIIVLCYWGAWCVPYTCCNGTPDCDFLEVTVYFCVPSEEQRCLHSACCLCKSQWMQCDGHVLRLGSSHESAIRDKSFTLLSFQLNNSLWTLYNGLGLCSMILRVPVTVLQIGAVSYSVVIYKLRLLIGGLLLLVSICLSASSKREGVGSVEPALLGCGDALALEAS
jgi:hypothetical protein